MARTSKSKYGPSQHPHVLCPIFVTTVGMRLPEKEHREKATIVYARENQVWQKIPQVLDFVASTTNFFNFILMVPNVSEISSGLAARGADLMSANITVSSGSRNEVLARYAQSDFGLLLRDDHVVNRVACPTKLIEYLHCGIVPVVEGRSSVSLANFGIRSVQANAMAAGDVPDYEERQKMASSNREILQKLVELSLKGKEEINAILSRAGRGRRNKRRLDLNR